MFNRLALLIVIVLSSLSLTATVIEKGRGCPSGKCPNSAYQIVKQREYERVNGLPLTPLPGQTYCPSCHDSEINGAIKNSARYRVNLDGTLNND